MAPPSDPVIGTDRSVVDTVVSMVSRGSYRSARLQLNFHQRRNGLEGVTEMVAKLTAPPADVDPRVEPIARQNIPPRLPDWLSTRTRDEVGRICSRQSIGDTSIDSLIARLLAASIVDDSVPAPDVSRLPHRPHVDLRDPADGAIVMGSAVDVEGDSGWVEPGQERRPDRSLTDWLARKP